MKILIVSQVYYPERFSVNDVAETLVKHGHKVTVVTGKPNVGFQRKLPEYRKVKFEQKDGVDIFRVNLIARRKTHFTVILNYLSFYFNSKRFMRHFKEEFDVVLSFSISPVTSIACANLYAKKHNVKHVLMCEDLWPESTVVTGAIRMNSLFYKILYKWSVSLYSKCDKILISSPSFEEYFKNVLHIEGKGFKYINQPIILSRNKLEPISYSNKFNILYAGNIGTLQLIDNMVDAMKLLKGQDIKLYISGMGILSNKLAQRISTENLEDVISFIGPNSIEVVESYVVNIDALIASLKEGGTVGKTIPNKAIQYMSYGKPIVGIIKGDGKDLLAKANGTVFANEDPESIKEAILKIASMSKQERLKLGSNNKSYYDKNLTVDQIVSAIEDELIDSK